MPTGKDCELCVTQELCKHQDRYYSLVSDKESAYCKFTDELKRCMPNKENNADKIHEELTKLVNNFFARNCHNYHEET